MDSRTKTRTRLVVSCDGSTCYGAWTRPRTRRLSRFVRRPRVLWYPNEIEDEASFLFSSQTITIDFQYFILYTCHQVRGPLLVLLSSNHKKWCHRMSTVIESQESPSSFQAFFQSYLFLKASYQPHFVLHYHSIKVSNQLVK